MSSAGEYNVGLIALAPVLAVLAAAGVAGAVARGVADLAAHHAGAGLRLLNLHDLEEGVHGAAASSLIAARAERLRLAAALPVQPRLQTARARPAEPDARLAEAAESLARADAADAALRAQPVLAAVAGQWQGRALADARAARLKAAALFAEGNAAAALEHAALAESRLVMAAHDAYERLGRAQQTVVAQHLSEVLQARGYAVRRHADGRGIALWAERPERTVAAVVAGGRLDLDMGADGLSCGPEIDAIAAALRARGVEMRAARVHLHGRRDGGALVARAAREARRSGLAAETALLAAMPPGPRAPAGDDATARARAWMWNRLQQTGGPSA